MARATRAAKKNASSASRSTISAHGEDRQVSSAGNWPCGFTDASVGRPMGPPLRAKLTEWFLGLVIGPPPGALRNLLRDTLATRDQITAAMAGAYGRGPWGTLPAGCLTTQKMLVI
jgi:hypothetical protein